MGVLSFTTDSFVSYEHLTDPVKILNVSGMETLVTFAMDHSPFKLYLHLCRKSKIFYCS